MRAISLTLSGVVHWGSSKNLWLSFLSLLSLMIQLSLHRQSHRLPSKWMTWGLPVIGMNGRVVNRLPERSTPLSCGSFSKNSRLSEVKRLFFSLKNLNLYKCEANTWRDKWVNWLLLKSIDWSSAKLKNAPLSIRVTLHDVIDRRTRGRASFRVPYWPSFQIRNKINEKIFANIPNVK